MLMLRPEAVISSLLFMSTDSVECTADYLRGQLLNVCIITCSDTPRRCPLWIHVFKRYDCVGGGFMCMRVSGHLQRSGVPIQELVLAFDLVFFLEMVSPVVAHELLGHSPSLWSLISPEEC